MCTQENKTQTCTNCHHILDDYTGLDNAIPKPGALSVCAYCGHISVFQEGLSLRDITYAEREDLRINHPDVYRKVMECVYLIRQRVKLN